MTITINRPKVRNSLRSNTLKEFESVLDESSQNEQIRALIVTGYGEIAFCAGGDIKEMELMGENEARVFAELSHTILRKIERLEKPVIAAVNGFAFGAGCDLASACDITVASDKAQFGMPSTHLGIITPFGGTQRLPRIVGPKFAKYMMLTGESIHAGTAREVGIVTKVVPHDSLLLEAKRIAQEILGQAPIAIRSIKRLVNLTMENKSLEDGDKLEIDLYAKCFATEDKKEGMRAFLEKRQPAFKGT